MYAYVLVSIADFSYAEEVRRFPALALNVLPDEYHTEPEILRFGQTLYLFLWKSRAATPAYRERVNPGVIGSEDSGWFFTSGYTQSGLLYPSGPGSVPAVFDMIRPTADGIRLSASTGGVGANMWISPDATHAACWSTQPPAITTFYAKNRRGLCAIGNRPRLVYAASTLSTGYRVDRDYISKYIVSGFAIDGTTPFANTLAVPANRALTVEQGQPRIVPYPLGPSPAIPQTQPLEEKSSSLAQLLRDAVWPADVSEESALFLSGGKDSRTLACALTPYAARVFAFTTGSLKYGEGRTASEAAARLGANFRTRSQKMIAHPLKAAAVSNLATDGLGIAVAQQYDFVQDLEELKGAPSFHGHGHLLRGGFARTMALREPEALKKRLYESFISPFVTPGSTHAEVACLDRWWAQRKEDFRDGRDLLFYSNADFRLGLFTSSSAMELTSKTFMVYPLLDERVARFASGLAVFDRVSERVVFGAMRELNRGLTDMPLFGEIWRFDRTPDKRDFVDSNHNFQDGFANRQPEEANKESALIGSTDNLVYDADRAEKINSIQLTADFICTSSIAPMLRSMLLPEIVSEIEHRSKTGERGSYLAKMDVTTRFNLNAFISRVYIAATLCDLRW